MFSNFFKCAVNITDRGHATHNTLAIDLYHVLKYAMRGGMRGTNIQGNQLVLRIVVFEDRLIRCYLAYKFAHIV